MGYALTGGYGWNMGYRLIAVFQAVLTVILIIESAALERRFKELREWETGGTWNGGTTIPERDCFHTWSRRSDDHIFLLLCTGTDYQFVGKQLSCSETGTVGGDGSRDLPVYFLQALQ